MLPACCKSALVLAPRRLQISGSTGAGTQQRRPPPQCPAALEPPSPGLSGSFSGRDSHDSADERFYTPRASGRRGGYVSSGDEPVCSFSPAVPLSCRHCSFLSVPLLKTCPVAMAIDHRALAALPATAGLARRGRCVVLATQRAPGTLPGITRTRGKLTLTYKL